MNTTAMPVGENLVEQGGQLRVAVADQVSDRGNATDPHTANRTSPGLHGPYLRHVQRGRVIALI